MTASTKTERVYFSIDGLWLSNTARDMVLEGKWETALSMLMEDVHMPRENAIAVLRGLANLTGIAQIGNPESSLGYEELFVGNDTATKMEERINRLYGTGFDFTDPGAKLTEDFIAFVDAATTVKDIKTAETEYENKFDALNWRKVASSQWDKKEAAHKHARKAMETILAAKVREQADSTGGWYELKLADKHHPNFTPSSIKVPKNAFILWALRGFRFNDFGKEEPKWPFIAGQGWKMYGDDPYHTDWMLGAGIPLDETYERDTDDSENETLASRVRSASFDAKNKLVKEWTGVDFSILSKGDESWVSGKVFHPNKGDTVPPGSIAVIPNAGPDYYNAMISANKPGEWKRPGLIICETGGKLAHLAVVGREQKCTVIMVPNALKLYPPGSYVSVSFDSGRITLTI